MPQRCDNTSSRLISVDRPTTLARAADRLRALLSSMDATALTGTGRARVLRLEHAIEPIDPCAWLAAQPQDVRLYWESRDNSLALAGAGTSLVIDSADHSCVAEMRHHLADNHTRLESRFWVSTRFCSGVDASAEWTRFGTVRCYLARIEIRRTNNGCVLACHIVCGASADNMRREIEQGTKALTYLGHALPPKSAKLPALPTITLDRTQSQTDTDEAAWQHIVQATLAEIRSTRVQKVVLARSVPHHAAEPLCPVGILQRLSHHNPGTFRFCIQVAPHNAFVGASPELLYRRQDRDVQSEAMAGTRPRSTDETQDAELAAELQASEKETLEQRLVRDHVLHHLGPLCEDLTSSGDPTIHRLPNVQHLRTSFCGRLRTGIDDSEILTCLHPTPAVCGVPGDTALAHIETGEMFDRGLYGGVVGSFGVDDAECAVAIRCGLVHDRELRLFAGAGIVEGSVAAAEWCETVNKMRAFAGVLTNPGAQQGSGEDTDEARDVDGGAKP